MLQSRTDKTPNTIDTIIANATAGGSSPLFGPFLTKLFAHISPEEIAQYDTASWQKMGEQAFSFAGKRAAGQPALRIYNDAAYTTMEIINDDKPFLVDSITAELSRRHIRVFQLLHPIIHVKRDKDGVLQSIVDQPEAGSNAESMIIIQINAIASEDERQVLARAILEVLAMVGHAVADWKTILHHLEESVSSLEHQPASDDIAEAKNFLGWLGRDNFTFLGMIDRNTTGEEKADSALGIFHMQSVLSTDITTQLLEKSNHQIIEIGKVNRISKIHRPVYMDYIALRLVDKAGKTIGERVFIGLFTSVVYYQSATLIPIIKRKIDSVIKRSGFSPVSHNGKEIVTILEAFPRDELFEMSENELFEICMSILALYIRPRVHIFVRKDNSRHFISCIVFIPRDRFSARLSERIEQTLEARLNGKVASQYVQVTDMKLARLHVIINTEMTPEELDIASLEKELETMSSLWIDHLRQAVSAKIGEVKCDALFQHYQDAFPEAYKDRYPADLAVYKDIEQIERALSSGRVIFNIYQDKHDPDIIQLKIYSPLKEIMLSEVMPILENMGFDVIDEYTFPITPISIHAAKGNANLRLHHFRLNINGMNLLLSEETVNLLEDALSNTWDGLMQDDGFNKLIILASLSWRQVVYIRALSKYLRQTGFTYSQEYCEEVLARQPELTRKLVELFYARFDPSVKQDEAVIRKIIAEIETDLSKVTSSAEDTVVRRFYETSQAMLRTNYFQHHQGDFKPYMSFKFNSALVPGLPLPRPYAEIFVYSPRVEGIHLRGGKVARGGLRWSDRGEDFRTEVLGLMKAQMAKNSVIVPVGSKGGFIVKQSSIEQGREAYMQEGIECYKTFLRGLLDITDNIEGGNIVPPLQVVRHDMDDPYLVVAADKGTATFSDTANSISEEYGFWLGDAFASGGSVGYDHKKMAITARGAWISVERHLREMGKDISTTDFTVIGIGDMSGDVFGNGMLLSKHIELIGAFNHMHIFLDPNPDAENSFIERERLFNLPRSGWNDYNPAFISEGGGIFERKAKSITLTPQVKARFGINQDHITPDELIRVMLLAPVDLLWNGGIGTYIKASDEKNDEVGDKANDAIRVNGRELRALVIGEGGNLGCSQRGRIEYALAGGRLNTDAIDNSAGVDCSDHEVNIKIALQRAVESGKLSQSARNDLLREMTEDVAALVLRDNTLQTQALTIAQLQGFPMLGIYVRLMQKLERAGLLDRKVEFLPSDADIARRIADRVGFTRPELAVLLAYSKIALYSELLASDLPDDPYFSADLMLYFPEKLRSSYKQEIEKHPLRREIIATFVTNSIINRSGSPFVHLAIEDTGLKACDIARAYTITRDCFDLRSLWLDIETAGTSISAETQVELFLEVEKLIQRVTFWFLRNIPQPMEVTKIVSDFNGINELAATLDQAVVGRAKEAYELKLERYLSLGVPAPLASRVAALDALSSGCIIVQIAKRSNQKIHNVARVYFEIATRFNLSWLRNRLDQLPADNYWQRLAISTLKDQLYDLQMRLTSEVIRYAPGKSDAVESWCIHQLKQVERYDHFLTDLKSNEAVDFAMIVVAAKRVESLFVV